MVAGCGFWRGAVRPAVPTSAEELLAGLAARRAAVTSLRARVRLRAGLGGAWTREALLVRRPDAVRIDVLSPFGLVLALGTCDAFLWAYPTGEGTRYEGPATPANVTRFLGAPFTVADLVDILLGVPPARTVVGTPTLELTHEGEYRLTLPENGRVQTIRFTGDTLTVLGAEEVENGVVVMRVGFADYQDGFPRTLDVGAPGTGAGARLAYERVELNAPVDLKLFAPPPASQVMPLEAAGEPVSE